MNKNKVEEDLIAILKEDGMEKPSSQFSIHLTQSVVRKYGGCRPAEFKAAKWLGKAILSVLVFFNLLFLYFLNPFSVQPVLFIAVAAFVLGLWVLIGLISKIQGVIFPN